MDIEKIEQELNKRFSEPLPEFYKRRIIFWHDEEREFAGDIGDIHLTAAKIIVLTGTNNFSVKKLLNYEDISSNYLVYVPYAYEKKEDNWLLDMEYYSETFRSDLVSIWIDEMGLPQTPALRSVIKSHRKFFNNKERRALIAKQENLPTAPAQLLMAMMAVLSDVNGTKSLSIIKAVLKGGLENNGICRDFEYYDLLGDFGRMLKQCTGYDEEPLDVSRLSAHILLTAATRTMRQEFLTGLESLISSPHQAFCYDLVSEWMHSDDAHSIRDIAEYVENEALLPKRFMKLTLDDLCCTDVFPCIDEVILIKLMRDIANRIIDTDAIKSIVEKRRTCAWYESVKSYYDGILQVADMQDFYMAHTEGFHFTQPKDLWNEYTASYYLMDTYYRLFHRSYAISQREYNEVLSDLFAGVRDMVEGLYIHWFLKNLSENWTNVCKESMEKAGRVTELTHQTDFYRNKIKSADAKVYVIISDAMRYEVCASLAQQLRRETQSQVEISSMQGIFPTITKFGMAALLPHKELTVELRSGERLSVLADGQSTDAQSRDKVLKQANENSVALKFRDIIGMRRADRQALIKGMDVVYIYHDTIDEAGHSEKSVFSACDDAINEIKNMVRIITNEFGGTNIIITSDHGFLYTFSQLREDDKVDKTVESEQDIEIGRRYAIMRKGQNPQYLLPIKFLDGNTEYEGFTPSENTRIKIRGSNLNFVHGGISLQEMVVPVISYHFLRNDSREYQRNRSKYDIKPVTISLLTASRKICNMIFTLSFYQKEPAAGNREAASYQLYFTDSAGKVISDTSRVIADKASDNVQDRTFRCTFNLKSQSYSSTEVYYLIIADENGMEDSLEEFQIDIAFAVDDFDFFS